MDKMQGGVMGWFDRLKSSKKVDKHDEGRASEGEQDAIGLLEKGSLLEQQGQLDDALSKYDKAIRLTPDFAKAHFYRGNILLAKGDAAAAHAAYERALLYKPDSAPAHYNLGNACLRMGRHLEAVTAYQQALRLKSDFTDVEVALGVAQEELGQLEAAAASYRRALALKPGYVEVHLNLAAVLMRLGRNDAAEASYRQALEITPDNVETLNTMGKLLIDLRRPADAEVIFRQSLAIEPDDSEMLNYLGAAQKSQGKFADAAASFQRVLEIDPEAVLAHNNLGVALSNLGQLDAAVQSYRKALQINPDFIEVHHNLGNALRALGQTDLALESFDRALKIAPDFVEAINGVGLAFLAMHRFDDAVKHYQRALVLKPDFALAHGNLGHALQELGQFSLALKSIRRALELDPDFSDAYDTLLFMHNYLGDQPASQMLAEARRYGEMVARLSTPYRDWSNPPDASRPLRIGLVSGDLCNHPVGFFAEGILAALATRGDRLALRGYPTSVSSDPISERIRMHCQSWLPVVGLSDAQLAERIRSDGIDILIDLSGHTAFNRLAMFAWKPAPVQVSWLGYFATTGVAEIDYLIADPWTLPVSEECNFTETIWRLPETRLCFTPPDEEVSVSPLPALANGYVTFGCFNNLSKMNDAVVALWARVMNAVPGSRLFLKARQLMEASIRQSIAERFALHGVDAARLIFEDYTSRGQYLAAYQRLDIALDPFPYPGGTTTVEALWMGVPVLTLAGERFLSRQGVGLLMNAGLPEWIATDPDDYVARAVAHAGDLDRLAKLRSGLRQQVLASPIFDAQRFAGHFEAALRGMWKTWCDAQTGQSGHTKKGSHGTA